jgi:hypothetical protein
VSDPREAEHAITDFLHEYYNAFAAAEYGRIALEMCRAPLVMTTAERVDTFAIHSEIEAMFKATGTALVADGYSHSELLGSEISVLSDTTALAATRFRRLRRDGSVILEAGATYTLLCEDTRWRINAAILHDTEHIVSLPGKRSGDSRRARSEP